MAADERESDDRRRMLVRAQRAYQDLAIVEAIAPESDMRMAARRSLDEVKRLLKALRGDPVETDSGS